MKAMILAAGLGTRLRPLTNDRPKALVELNGRTVLEINLMRLRSFGVTDVIINVHHFADKVVDYLKSHNNFGLHFEISREDDLLLDTGGGLKKAAWFFLQDPSRPNSAEPGEPFILHNVDILTNIDLAAMLKSHRESNALATLAVQHRESSRLLLFDQDLQLRGRSEKGARVSADSQTLAFSGIHVISPKLLPLLTETGAFSIIDSYVRLAAQGHKILAFHSDQYYWRDLGRPNDLTQAATDLARGIAK